MYVPTLIAVVSQSILKLNLLPGATGFAYVPFKPRCLGCSSESLYFPRKIYIIVDDNFYKIDKSKVQNKDQYEETGD